MYFFSLRPNAIVLDLYLIQTLLKEFIEMIKYEFIPNISIMHKPFFFPFYIFFGKKKRKGLFDVVKAFFKVALCLFSRFCI